MKRLFLSLMVVLAAALFSAATAQEDSLLTQYGLAHVSLEDAVTALNEGNGVLAREELDRTLTALRPVQNEADSDAVVEALSRTIGQAQTAVQNRSQTDLAVQVAVLQGGFWRLVYEAALNAAPESPALARERLNRIAVDMELPEEALSALAAQTNPAAMLTLLEQGITTAIGTKLAQAADTVDDRDAAYEALAEAYGLFIPVQDSPRASGAETGLFSQAFVTVTADPVDTAVLSAQITSLDEEIARFAQAAETGQAAPIAPVTVSEVTPSEALSTEAATPNAAVPATEAAADLGTPTEAGTQAAPAPEAVVPLTLPPAQPDTSALEAEFGRFGVPSARRAALAEDFLAAGFEEVGDVTDQLFAESARLVVAVETGDQIAAQNALRDIDDAYTDYAAPLLANSEFDRSMRNLLNTLQGSPALRLQDAAVLTGHVQMLSDSLNGLASSGLHNLIVATTNVWSGWLRAGLMVLLGLLALVPLYLLRLAFGGGNRNWQLIGGALFCLLLPLMYEGLSFIFTLISSFSGGIATLDTLASFSIFQNTLSQVAWAILSALAIILASAGLYGICVQFGLLGRRTASTRATTMDTAAANTAINTSFDWDEEF